MIQSMRQRLNIKRLFIVVIVCAMALNVVANSAHEEEHWLSKGTEFYFDGQTDSAKVYLEQVFLTDTDEKTTAAKFLLDIALAQGDTLKINEYALFLAENYDVSLNQERQKSHRRILLIAVTALLALLVMGWIIFITYKRHKTAEAILVEEQQRERESYDRQLNEAQSAIERQTFENLQRQAREVLSRGSQRKRILEAFNATYPKAYERLKTTYPDLSEQEYDLLILNFLEFRIKEEAEILELSQNTVMKYRSNLLKKVGKDPLVGLLG
jgi:hypothetical protein